MIVVDASAALSGLLNDGLARSALATDDVHVPHLIDAEVASGLRRLAAAGRIDATDGWRALDAWRRLGMTRYALHPMLERVWELRANVSAYEAGYLALAESLDCDVVTADVGLGKAPGIRCAIRIVPR